MSLDKSRQACYARRLYFFEPTMSLRKSPHLTPALLDACRRNARKSTGPRTKRGKGNVRMNALREGGRSQLWREFATALFYAPPGGIGQVAAAWMTPELARLPLFAEHAEVAIESELPRPDRLRRLRALCRGFKKKGIPYFCEQSANVIENNDPLT